MSRQSRRLAILFIASGCLLHGEALRAQPSTAPLPDWNGAAVRELVARARAARANLAASSDLQSYQARTEGHVYFFVDPEQGERYLIRIDQVAAEVRWEAPDRMQQHIVGERSETRLPVRDFDYYLDRLTLVPHGFGDEIIIGSGLDVVGVVHPLASLREPEGEFYDFRLGDSLTLVLPGREDPVRIREVAVRPRDPDRPGILGTIHLDQASASIVRMAFTFTPASYVDPRNDRVSVELDYGLWDGRYWLPNVQKIEVRREMPAFDLGIGTVIRAVLQVRDYTLDVPLPDHFLTLPRVTFLSEAERSGYSFSTGLYESMEEDGLGELVVDADLRELRARAMELLETVPPSGLSPIRLHFPAFSSLVRYGRAEGARVGFGGSVQPRPGARIRGSIGYAVADARGQVSLAFEELLDPRWTVGARIRVRNMEDLGLTPGSAPVISSLGGLTRGEDYLDPFWVTSGGISLEYRTDEASLLRLGIGVEQHSNAALALTSSPLNGSNPFRPVRPVAESEFFRFDFGLGRSVSWLGGGRAWGQLDGMLLHGQEGTGLGLSAGWDERWALGSPAHEIELEATGWTWLGDSLPQGHRLLGGRGTLPGFAYRQFVGERAASASVWGSTDLIGPLVRLRGGLHAGWAGGGDAQLSERWDAVATDGPRASASVGLGLGWDLLRLDLARGLGGGEWQLVFSIDQRWWDRL